MFDEWFWQITEQTRLAVYGYIAAGEGGGAAQDILEDSQW